MRNIADDMGTVVSLMEPITGFAAPPFYKFGHPLEIALLLSQENQALNKYPAIFLKLDTPEGVKANGYVHFNLTLLIVAYTIGERYAFQRLEQVFKPILYPLYEEFFKALRRSGLFSYSGVKPEHVKVDRFNLGAPQVYERSTDKRLFTDPLDAIEISNLELKQLFNLCK